MLFQFRRQKYLETRSPDAKLSDTTSVLLTIWNRDAIRVNKGAK